VHTGAKHDTVACQGDEIAIERVVAGPRGTLEDGDEMTGLIERVGRAETGRARSDHGDVLPGPARTHELFMRPPTKKWKSNFLIAAMR
jgi:hypothetical protein